MKATELPSGRPRLALSKRGTARWRSGHPWIFRDDVEARRLANGEIVEVVSPAGEPLGSAFYGSVSKIALRRLAGPGEAADADLLLARLDRAIDYRRELAPEAQALRLVSSDADGIPGLVVDRYGDHLVLQSLTAGVERLLEPLVARLVERTGAASIFARLDAGVRRLEGLPMENRVLRGEVPKWVEYEEAGLILGVDIQGGQKTGSFLDQRENRLAAAGYLRGRVLDAFCYDGGFALHAARRAGSVEAVDSSEAALERGARNALRNGIGNVRFVRANVFDRLHEASSCGERFDGVILDPPAFAKSRADLEAAGRAYKEINLRALKCLEPRGILVTCSCSYNLLEDEFVKVVAAAAADAKRRVIIVEKRSQARDHPVLLGLPESQYLKCLILKAE